MAGFLPPTVAYLLGNITDFKAKMAEAQGVSEETDAKLGGMGAGSKAALLGFGAVIAGVTYESVKLATSFQSSMEMLATQAGVPQSQIASLSQGVLNLAGQVGWSPDSLAQALYHIESSFASVGITGPQALNLLKIAAEGAATGHANLVDVTNALDAAVVSGIPGVQNLQQAMGILNATVGAGDMEMQDLADAFSTGLLASVKGYGLSITDVGAALAVFGDNNIRGAVAATDLRMAVQSMAVPAKAGAKQLSDLGMTTTQMAKDLQTGGLLKALEDLKTHMVAAGITSKEQGQVLTTIFGKKAGVGINVLYDQLDRLQSKYPVLKAGAEGFGDAWTRTKGTFSQAMKSVGAEVEALMTQFGLKLLPILTKVANWFVGSIGWLQQHKAVLAVLAGLVAGALVSALYAAVAATIAWTAALDVNPIFLIITAIAGLVGGLIYAYNHFRTFRNIVDEVGRFLKSVFAAAWQFVGGIVRWFVDGPLAYVKQRLDDFKAFWKGHGQEIMAIVKVVWGVISRVIAVAVDIFVGYIKVNLDLLKAVWKSAFDLLWGTTKIIWKAIADVFTAVFHWVLNAVGVFLDIFTGHWGKAWTDAKKLVSQGISDVKKIFSDFASGAIHMLEQAGKDLINGLINGVKSMWNDVKSTLSSLTNAITSWKGPPEKDAVLLHKSGQLIMKGLIAGIVSQKGALRTELGNVTGMIGVGGTLGGLSLTGTGIGGGVSAGGGVVVVVNVQGSVHAAADLATTVRQEILRYQQRNSGNRLALPGYGR